MSDITQGLLFTDFYQLTMAQLYFRTGMQDRPVQFEYFFRNYPDYGGHQAGYCVFAGLESLWQWMATTRARSADIAALRAIRGASGQRLFAEDFLDWLREAVNFKVLTVEAVPEGRIVHPNVPLVVVRGPLAVAQLLETSLLNHLNYQTLIATKAARIAHAAEGQPVIDFGMRRGYGMAVNQATRAALIGGAAFSSNTGASCALGFSPKGTHAHSMIQAFIALGKSEQEAFAAYAALYPDDCILLVDSINTLTSGIPHAIEVFTDLRRRGHKPVGIRLDSGDLAYLSMQAHSMLNDAGFPDVHIVLSNQLDEIVIAAICRQIRAEATAEGIDAEALLRRLVYGVGASLVTSKGASALDGVYKLTAMQQNGEWIPTVKLSESSQKVPNPGSKRIWRIYDQRHKASADLIALSQEEPRQQQRLVVRHPLDPDKHRVLVPEQITAMELLLAPFVAAGDRVRESEDMALLRQRRTEDLQRLDAGVQRLVNPHIYHVCLSEALWTLKRDLVRQYAAG